MKNPLQNSIVVATSLAFVTLGAASAAPHRNVSTNPPASQKFTFGERVQTTRKTAVWAKPPTAGTFAGSQRANSPGVVVGGPVRAADGWWWKINFDAHLDGWAAQRDLAGVGVSSVPMPMPTPGESDTPAPTPSIFAVSPPDGAVVHTAQTVLRGKITHDIYSPSQITATINGSPLILDPTGNFSVTVHLTPGNNDFTFQATTPNPRQQTTVISGYLDGSMIYGSDATRARALRTFQRGLLKTSAGNLPPLNTDGLDNANDANIYPDNQLFLAGDVRANENIELTAIHALFVREHNLIASAMAVANPGLADEEIYQRTRRVVVAEVQVITYREFLPALLGPNALRPYPGYNPDVNPGIATEFSTAAYRIGHTLVNDDVEFLDNDGNETRTGLSLADAFFNPVPLEQNGPDPLLKYLSSDNAQEVDTQLVDGLRNYLFGPPGAGGLDLASLNIQRGRDHGLPDYNTVRIAYGLPPIAADGQITSDSALQNNLFATYGDMRTLDLWVAGLAEDHVPGSSVGPTFQKIIVDQFERTRDGDRNWYQRTFSGRQLAALEATRLSEIIRRNTAITKLQDNVFFYDPASTLAGLTARAAAPISPDLLQAPNPAAGSMPAPGPDAARTPPAYDGTGNNPIHPDWGTAGADLLRFSPAAYGDAVSVPAGAARPSPRAISNAVCVHTTLLDNSRLMSSWIYGWGQFVDHDLDLTTTGDTEFDIAVPTGDPSFDPESTGTQVIPFTRSNYDATTGTAGATTAGQVERIIFTPGGSGN